MTQTTSMLQEIQGTITRKKRQQEWIVYAVQEHSEAQSKNVYLSRTKHSKSYGGRELNASYDAFCKEFLFLQAIVLIKGYSERVKSPKQPDGEARFYVSAIELVQCAPDPNAVHNVLLSLAEKDGRFQPTSLFMNGFQPEVCEDLGNSDYHAIAQRILLLAGRPRRKAVAELIRQLEGLPATRRGPRRRPPHIRKSDLQLLQDVEGCGKSETSPSWRLMGPVFVELDCPGDKHEAHRETGQLPLNLPTLPRADFNNHENLSTPSATGKLNRLDYLTIKKTPQVQWMTKRVRSVLANVQKDNKPIHIVDVGGGRGDLATALALAIPECLVSVVDLNLPSLEAGQMHAQRMGLSSRMFFINANFSEFIHDPASFYADQCNLQSHGMMHEEASSLPPPVNLVVALHACGDLSDLALAYAQQISCPFVVCPCCYTKRYNSVSFEPAWCRLVSSNVNVGAQSSRSSDDQVAACTLGRLAELNEEADVCRRAMTIINSMRLSHLEDFYKVSLEEYENKSSKRNLVLVGCPR